MGTTAAPARWLSVFIAHAPLGFLLGRALGGRGAVAAAVVGGLVPDLDMVRFVVDGGAVHHHRYWTHLPACWAAIAAVTAVVVAATPLRRWARVFVAFFAGVLSHLVADTVAGDIAWLWPIDDAFVHVVAVAATGRGWIADFLLHPTFLVEVVVVVVAAVVFARDRRARVAPGP